MKGTTKNLKEGCTFHLSLPNIIPVSGLSARKANDPRPLLQSQQAPSYPHSSIFIWHEAEGRTSRLHGVNPPTARQAGTGEHEPETPGKQKQSAQPRIPPPLPPSSITPNSVIRPDHSTPILRVMPRLSGSGKSAAAPPQRSVSSAPNDAGGEHGHVNSDSGSGSGHSNSGNSDNRTAAPPHPAAAAAAAAAAASTEMRRQLERKRQRELADVDLVCAPAGAKATDAARRSSRGSRPPDEDDPGRREASSRSSRSSTSSSSNVAQTTTLPPPPPKKKKACANGSRTKTSPVVVPLAELEKPRRRRRLRRESDKMYEEWEKADGRYKVAFRRPAESDRHPAESGRGTAAAFNVRGKYCQWLSLYSVIRVATSKAGEA